MVEWNLRVCAFFINLYENDQSCNDYLVCSWRTCLFWAELDELNLRKHGCLCHSQNTDNWTLSWCLTVWRSSPAFCSLSVWDTRQCECRIISFSIGFWSDAVYLLSSRLKMLLKNTTVTDYWNTAADDVKGVQCAFKMRLFLLTCRYSTPQNYQFTQLQESISIIHLSINLSIHTFRQTPFNSMQRMWG